jgi:hypothetical protein
MFPTFGSFPKKLLSDSKHIKDKQDDIKKDDRKTKKRRKESKTKAVESLDFYNDKRGDLNNVVYQTIHNSAVPIYKRCRNQILGSAWKINSKNIKYLIIYKPSDSEDKTTFSFDTDNPIHIPTGLPSQEKWPEFLLLPQVIYRDQASNVFADDLKFQHKCADFDRQIVNVLQFY